MREPTSGASRPEHDAWEALHQGLDREGLDSPSRYVLNKSAVLLPVRVPGLGRHGPPAVAQQSPAMPKPAVPATGSTANIRHRMLMRPYARTRGRTRPDYDLALEALVSTSERGRRFEGAVSVQHRRICELCCVATRSVAEIAAYLVLPLNVVKVLVSDMDNLGLVMIHQPGLTFGDRSSREFMARVLKGLRSI
ncbi:MAG TPA: DUF742 domain-containing protein [Amycolatopsis sp.]|uniref:DUF742 domain-containing protein n=1 Tax=Amycolatopsis sp. TaxID=37632 RepID=UPI002B46CCAB|nr:DUF742 domain-containing protein [Amycolatopsis sp.]HKS45158.1 DUF742 domain-containing protein [Amycolatopsis sp.]